MGQSGVACGQVLKCHHCLLVGGDMGLPQCRRGPLGAQGCRPGMGPRVQVLSRGGSHSQVLWGGCLSLTPPGACCLCPCLAPWGSMSPSRCCSLLLFPHRSEFSDTILSVHPSDVLDMPVDPNEPTYCLCHQVSYGEMIGCDNPDVSVGAREEGCWHGAWGRGTGAQTCGTAGGCPLQGRARGGRQGGRRLCL